MIQNIYDNSEFFAAYKHLRDTASASTKYWSSPRYVRCCRT